MYEFERVATQEIAGAVAEQPFDGRAGVANDAVVAENRDDVRSVFGKRAEMLFALPQGVFRAPALDRRGEDVRQCLHEQDVGAAEFAALRTVGADHAPRAVAPLHHDAQPARDAILEEVRGRGKAGFRCEVLDDERRASRRAQRIGREGAGVRADQRPADAPLPPSLTGAQDEAAVLRLEFENVAEFDVEPARHERGGGMEEVGPRRPGQRVLAKVGDRLLLAGRRAELLLGTVRFLDAEPAEPLRAQRDSRGEELGT